MFVDGKKYACDACVRGHRVSGCNHNDRPLQEIAKKGRPVSQCHHCRNMRKTRSSHVKCDCGERVKGTPKHHYINENGKLVEVDDSKEATLCQCPHGGRCTCSVKKDGLDRVPENGAISTPGSSASGDAPRKPRLQSTQSESCITRFTNGHHPPVHRHHSSHGAAPYHIPHHHHHHSVSEIARESLSDLDLSTSQSHILMPSDPEDIAASLQRQGMSKQIKSESASPSIASSGYPDGTESIVPPGLSRTISDFNLSGSRGMFELTLQTEFPQYEPQEYSDFYTSAVEPESAKPWSHYHHPNSATWPYDSNFDKFCEVPPGLTQSVSGDDSEVETWGFHPLPSPKYYPPSYLNGPFSTESSDFYESDHHDGLSTVSSRVGLSNMVNLPATDLGSVEHFLNAGYDGSSYNLNVQDGVSLNNFGLEEIQNNTYENTKTISPVDVGSRPTNRNSFILQDSEVLMMLPVTTQSVPLPPDFEAR